jgi:predicted TPR repeat methyltransferase
MDNQHAGWKAVWNRKQVDGCLISTLDRLISADGFDSPFGGGIKSSDWVQYLDSVAARLHLESGDSIFEIGCGAGAFLYPFFTKGHRVAGIDYSENLAAIAREVMPGAHILVDEAIGMPTDRRFDFVTSHSVFYYFEDLDYAAAVLRRMNLVAVKGIGIFDVPDAAKKDEAMRYRKEKIGEEEYERRYKGLAHLYYEKSWFERTLASEDLDIAIEDTMIPGYDNSPFRFNVFLRRKTVR